MIPVIGHGAIRRELRALAASVEPPHALMLVGQDGSGRRLLALELAALLNCEAPFDQRPCGACRACRLIAAGSHPDVVHLGPGDVLCKPRPGESSHESHPDSRDIRICQVRGLIDAVARYPFEGTFRVVIIEPADRFAHAAAHTILKTLEEPPPHTVFVLVTAAPEAILETIRSRCRRIDVGLVPRAEIEQGLIDRGVDPATAARAAAESRGRPGRAVVFAERPSLMDDRGRLLARCAQIAASRLSDRLAYAADLSERWRRDRQLVHAELDTWEDFWEQRLRAAVAAPEAASDAVAALRAVAGARDDLEANVQPRLALDLMLLRFPAVTLEPLATETTEETEAPAHA
ncbi:MAG: DNA polymerase III subunit delta' [Dehalococcoidia bacterium]